MGIPLQQKIHIARYILRKSLRGERRYPLVLMLEPLFGCNLACAGCGKIEHPTQVLKQRMSVAQALGAVDECDAPVVSIPGGEPLLHKDMPQIVAGIIARRKYVYLCSNALLLEKHIDDYPPSPYFTFSIHLDGNRDLHDRVVGRQGVFDIAVDAIKLARSRGHRVTINTTLFFGEEPAAVADFFDYAMTLGIEGITVSPAYSYEQAADQSAFLGRTQSKELFRSVLKEGRRRRSRWVFNQSDLFVDFLAGNQSYRCMPWSTPTFNIFGWQRPCYLLNEGSVQSYRELMNTTDWDRYGADRHPNCGNCMAHCGYEGTAVADTIAHPLKALRVYLLGNKLHGDIARDPAEGTRNTR